MTIEEALVQTVALVKEKDVDVLTVNKLKEADLTVERIGWSGGSMHVPAVREASTKVSAGLVEMVGVRAPNGFPISMGAVNFEVNPGFGTLWMLATHEKLRSLGIGSLLIDHLEACVKRRGLDAMIGVEKKNVRAWELYKRLGYAYVKDGTDSWQDVDESGKEFTYVADIVWLSKKL